MQAQKKWLIVGLFIVINAVQVFGQPGKEVVLVAFGNSTTAPRKTVKKVYPERVVEKLKEVGVEMKLINAAIPGSHTGSVKDNDRFKIQHGRDRFSWAVIEQNPQWLIICFGINDSWIDDTATGKSRIALEKYKENIRFFIDEAKKRGIRVIVMAPNPVGEKFEPFRHKRLARYAAACKKIAKKKKIDFVNLPKVFWESKYGKKGLDKLLLDGVHPNDEGHEIMAQAVFTIIKKRYKKHSKG